jgi:hypothetical protein
MPSYGGPFTVELQSRINGLAKKDILKPTIDRAIDIFI